MFPRTLLVIAGLLALPSCERPSSARRVAPPASTAPLAVPLNFVDASERAGIRFVHTCGGVKEKDYIIEANGGGCALFDADNDGDLDIFFVNGQRIESLLSPEDPRRQAVANELSLSDALYRNDGGFRFTDVTKEAGLVESAWGCGVAAADYDNDGDLDLYVNNYGQDCLWRNEGGGRFKDATEEAGLGDPGWGSSVGWLDYDRDGHLDLLVANYIDFDIRKIPRRGTDPSCNYKGMPIMCGPVGLPPGRCSLYRNRGDGTFEDASERAGIRSVPPSYSLGVLAIDYNRDDWLDILVTNDTRANYLFENRKDGTFADVALRAGVALNDSGVAQAGMGVDASFRGGKGYEDVFIVNFENDNNNYRRNEGNGFFTEITGPLNLAEPCFAYLGWSCFFFDPDLDGDEDLFVGQGHVVLESDRLPTSPGWRQPSKLFIDDRSGRFLDASNSSGPALQIKKSNRGGAYGDLDGDGDQDVVLVAMGEPATVIENSGPPRGHWLAVRTVGKKSNRDGVGAVVSLKAAGQTQMRRIRAGSSYASSSEIAARFGLGPSTTVDELRVRWPTGEEETYSVPGVDRLIRVEEGKGSR